MQSTFRWHVPPEIAVVVSECPFNGISGILIASGDWAAVKLLAINAIDVDGIKQAKSSFASLHTKQSCRHFALISIGNVHQHFSAFRVGKRHGSQAVIGNQHQRAFGVARELFLIRRVHQRIARQEVN